MQLLNSELGVGVSQPGGEWILPLNSLFVELNLQINASSASGLTILLSRSMCSDSWCLTQS